MVYKVFLSSILTLFILDIGKPLENKAAHKNNLINRFCIASIKSKLKSMDKQKIDDISHFTCKCFFKEYSSGSTIKNSRKYCKNKALEEFSL